MLETIAGRYAGSAPAVAARLLAASHQLRQALAAPVPPAERPAHDAALTSAQAALGAAGFTQCWDEGLTLSLDAAVELARQAARRLRRKAAATAAGARYGLTEREVAVLRLIGDGLTNRQVISEHAWADATSTDVAPVRKARREIATGSQSFQRLWCNGSVNGVLLAGIPLDGIPAHGIVLLHDSNS